MLIVAVVFQLSDGIQAVALGALRGLTDVKVPTWITFGVYWILVLPAAYFLSKIPSLGAMGIWYALAGGLTLSALLLSFRFRTLLIRFAVKLEKSRK
jgi:MATE family multidrug resistance protein